MLYNWYAVTDSNNIAPEGWHMPTDSEFQVLIDYLGGASVAGGKMKEVGTNLWATPNTGATNESGFTALPGGYRTSSSAFVALTQYAYFWSSSEGTTSSNGWSRSMWYGGQDASHLFFGKKQGLSVRCVKD